MILPMVLFVVSKIVGTYGHGRLTDPPARNSMWRFGFENPVNYNDNELFCGGSAVIQSNDGKCGLCGDNYADPVPRDHEDGGKYGNGIIVRSYKVGQQIPINVELTANHKGHMEIHICPNDDPNEPATQECLDSHPLNVVGQDTYKYSFGQEKTFSGTLKWDVQLPESLTCSRCVIQWKYVGGNMWGKCEDGTESDGCGTQETFVNCADVEILSSDILRDAFSYNAKVVYYSGNEFSNVVRKNDSIPDHELRPLGVTPNLCQPLGEFKNDKEMNDKCRINCMKYPPECPPSCKCVYDCDAIGEFAKKTDAKIFCLQNCFRFPSHCPEERCKCT